MLKCCPYYFVKSKSYLILVFEEKNVSHCLIVFRKQIVVRGRTRIAKSESHPQGSGVDAASRRQCINFGRSLPWYSVIITIIQCDIVWLYIYKYIHIYIYIRMYSLTHGRHVPALSKPSGCHCTDAFGGAEYRRVPTPLTAIFHTKNCQTENLWVKIPRSLR